MNRSLLVTSAAALLLSLGALSQTSEAGMVTVVAPTGTMYHFSFSDNAGPQSFAGPSGTGFSGSVTSATDPIISWSFTEVGKPGAYDVTFTIPLPSATYPRLSETAGVTISDPAGGNAPTSATGITINAQVPGGTTILSLTPPDVTAPAGGQDGSTVTAALGSKGMPGPYVSPGSMAVELKFTAVDTENHGSIAFTGSISLTKPTVVPEPASVALALSGLSVLGVGFVARRKRA